MMVLANMYFPYSEVPELFLAFRAMVTLMSARHIHKTTSMFAHDLEYLVQERPDEPVDETLFYSIFGKSTFIRKTILMFYNL